MKYTIGCLSNGQCEWDYTNTLFALEKNGKKDSVIVKVNNYSIAGVSETPDSFFYLNSATYKYFFNETTQSIDSVANEQIFVYLNNNPSTPTKVTDTLLVWPAVYRYSFDTAGKVIDSVFIKDPNLVIVKQVYSYYKVSDLYNEYELGRMITPYAKFFPKNFKYTYVFDVTDYVSKLQDTVLIRMMYSGYSFGFTCTVDFEFIEGAPARDVLKIERVYKGYFPYGNVNNSIENYLTEKKFTKDDASKEVKLRLTVTGHGGESNEGCSEFCAKKFYLKLNKNQIVEQLVWKDNCGENAIINQGGNMDLRQGQLVSG